MPQPWEKYAKAPPVQEEEGPWSQYGESAPSADAPPPDDRNSIQKSFDTNTSYQPNDPMLKKVLAGTAHGIGMPFVHPIQTAEGLADTMNLSHAFGPNAPAPKPMSDVGKELPYDLGEGFGGMALAEGAGAGLGEGIARIPSTARAGARISDIESQAANTPVNFQNTSPALQKFGQHVATGGKGADVMSKLGSRIPEGPMNFPEARDFYTNVSDVTRKPGMLRRAFEDAREPRLRYAAGPVREGMNADLTEALKPLNLDEDYNAALREYARGKALKTGLKRAGTAAIGAGAGAAGLGKAHGIVSSVFK